MSRASTQPRGDRANSGDALSSTALSAISQLVGLQLFSRGLTFVLNQVLVRVASPEVFGTATIQFELLLSTILFLSREGVRTALLRSGAANSKSNVSETGDNKTHSNASQLFSNISTIPILIGAPLSVLTTLLYFTSASPQTRSQPHFAHAISLYALSAFLELLSEPLYLLAISQLKVRIRVRAEGAAVVAKAVATVVLLVTLDKEWSLVAFAGGQVAYGAAVLGIFVGEYGLGSLRILPRRIEETIHGNVKTKYFDSELLRLAFAMTAQSVFKHFLTEGDRFLVSKFSPLKDQGGYAIATNYGSLIARIMFQPIEETSRLFFSKLLAQSKDEIDSDSGRTFDAAASSDTSQAPVATPSRVTRLTQALSVYHLTILFYTHLSLVFLIFGPPYLPTLLSLLLPKHYLHTSAPLILKAYCIYLPVMALNGFLEAFVASVATERELVAQGRWMMGGSLGFVGAVWGMGRVGANSGGGREIGLVYANVFNLGARAAYGWVFAKSYFARAASSSAPIREKRKEGSVDDEAGLEATSLKVDWSKCVPPTAVLIASAIAALLVRASAAWLGLEDAVSASRGGLRSRVIHVGIGAFFFALWAAIVAIKGDKSVLGVLKRRREV